MIDKLKENGIGVDFIMFLPAVSMSILVILFTMIVSVVGSSWIEFAMGISIMIAWMLGVFFGFKILLIRIELMDRKG